MLPDALAGFKISGGRKQKMGYGLHAFLFLVIR